MVGLWGTGNINRTNLNINGTTPIVSGDEWVPTYTGNWPYKKEPLLNKKVVTTSGNAQIGEHRSNIIADLCMNVIANGVTGLSGYLTLSPPNSDLVELSWDISGSI